MGNNNNATVQLDLSSDAGSTWSLNVNAITASIFGSLRSTTYSATITRTVWPVEDWVVALGKSSHIVYDCKIYGLFSIDRATAIFESKNVDASWFIITDAQRSFGSSNSNAVAASIERGPGGHWHQQVQRLLRHAVRQQQHLEFVGNNCRIYFISRSSAGL